MPDVTQIEIRISLLQKKYGKKRIYVTAAHKGFYAG